MLDKESMPNFVKGLLARATSKAIPKSLVTGLKTSNTAKAFEGYKRIHQDGGLDSLVAYLPMKAAEKVFGKEKTRDALWHFAGKPSLVADTAAGNLMHKLPGAKGLFTVTDKVPIGKKPGFYMDVDRASITAPLVKARNFAAPIVMGVTLDKGITKAVDFAKQQRSESDNTKTASDTKALFEKAASVMYALHESNKVHEKRAHALHVLYKQAEMGLTTIPSSYTELQEKLGELVNEDLLVYEKALKLAAGHVKLGELSNESLAPLAKTADQKFAEAVIGQDNTFFL